MRLAPLVALFRCLVAPVVVALLLLYATVLAVRDLPVRKPAWFYSSPYVFGRYWLRGIATPETKANTSPDTVAIGAPLPPLTAQSARDSAEIRAAAVKRGEKALAVRIMRIVADTAWVSVLDPSAPDIDVPSDGRTTAATVIQGKWVRVERRAGKWVHREGKKT